MAMTLLPISTSFAMMEPAGGVRTHITDYATATFANADVLHTVDQRGYTASATCAVPLSPCMDASLLDMISTTSLHPMKGLADAEYRRTLESANHSTINGNAAPSDTPLGVRSSAVGVGGLASVIPSTGYTSTNSNNNSNINNTSAPHAPSRSSQGSILRTVSSSRSQRGSTRNSPSRGLSLTPGTAIAPAGSQAVATVTRVPVSVTCQHILDGAQRALVLGYEDGSVRLLQLRHQENRDDGLPKSDAAAAVVPSDARHWTLAALFAAAPEQAPSMLAVSMRGAEFCVSRLEAGTVPRAGWAPVTCVHAIPCATPPLSAPPLTLSSTPQHTASSAGFAPGALVAVAYQDCVLVMLEPFVEAAAAVPVSSTQRRRPAAPSVRVIVSATTLRQALHEALSGQTPASAPSASSSLTHHPRAAGSPTHRSAPTLTTATANFATTATTTTPTAALVDGPLATDGVRLSPCGGYLSVHLTAPVLCVLVFELPSFCAAASESSPTATSSEVGAVITRAPGRLVAGCLYPGVTNTADTLALIGEDGAEMGGGLTGVQSASVHAESFFLASPSATEASTDGSEGLFAPSVVLMVAWRHSRCFTRLPLPQSTAQSTTRDLQRALDGAVEASSLAGTFDNVDIMRSGGRPSSGSHKGGRVASARRERSRASISATATGATGAAASSSRRPGSSGRRRSVGTTHSPPGTGKRRLPSALTSLPVDESSVATSVFARAQVRYATQIIQRACPVGGDPRLMLLGLCGGMVQLLDAQSTSRALFSVAAPSRVPVTAAEALRSSLIAAATRPPESFFADHTPFDTAASSPLGPPGGPLSTQSAASSRSPSLARTASARPSPAAAATLSKPVPSVTDVTLLQAFTGDAGELIVVASTTTQTVHKAVSLPSPFVSAPAGPSPLTTRPASPAEGVRGKRSVSASRAAIAPSAAAVGQRNQKNATLLDVSAVMSGPRTSTARGAAAEEAAVAAVATSSHDSSRASTAPLMLHAAAVIYFAAHQRSTPSEQCYLTHLPSPAQAVLPLHPLPAVLVSLATTECSTPLDGSVAERSWRPGVTGGLAPVTGATATPALPWHVPGPTTTLWWDVAFDAIIGTVPAFHPRVAPALTLLESVLGTQGGGPSSDNTMTELFSSSRLGTGHGASGTRSARLASTLTSTVGTSRRQIVRAQRKAEAEQAAAATTLPLLPARVAQAPACAWSPSWRTTDAMCASRDASVPPALREGPALLWLQDRSSPASTTPMCWPVQALLQLVYPTLVAQWPNVPLVSAAHILRQVPPAQRHTAVRYRQLMPEDAPGGLSASAPLHASPPSRVLSPSPCSRPQSSTRRARLRPPSRTLTTGAGRRKVLTATVPLPTLHRATGGAPRERTTATTVTHWPFTGGTTHFPRAWLAALGETAAERESELDTVMTQLHTSKV